MNIYRQQPSFLDFGWYSEVTGNWVTFSYHIFIKSTIQLLLSASLTELTKQIIELIIKSVSGAGLYVIIISR